MLNIIIPIAAYALFFVGFILICFYSSASDSFDGDITFDGNITFPDKQDDAEDVQEIDTHVCDQISESRYIKVKQYSYQDSSHKIRRTVWGLTFGDLDIDDDEICQIDHCPYCGKQLL